jgi:hypothetical protein
LEQASTWGFWLIPPTTSAVFNLQITAIAFKIVTYLHGQLTGGSQHQSPGGAWSMALQPDEKSLCRMGSAKAAVFPVPVWEQPNRSRPSKIGGMAALCMALVFCSPMACRAFAVKELSRTVDQKNYGKMS